MTIDVGDRVPNVTLFEPGASGTERVTTDTLFGGRKVVLVGMPGAFTPTCDRRHLPGFIENIEAFRAKGVNEIVILSTNDAHVLRAWADSSGSAGKVRFVSDGNAEFVTQAGLAFDASPGGMGTRAKRFAMIVDDGVVTSIAVEESPGKTDVSAAEQILAAL